MCNDRWSPNERVTHIWNGHFEIWASLTLHFMRCKFYISKNVKTSLLENAGITQEMGVFTFDNVKFTFVEIISLSF